MRYLLYLKKSFTRQPKRHLTLYIILTCAFILPLLISIYRDSSAHGEERRLLDMTKGAAFHIENASPEDAELFEGIEGLAPPVYEGGTIYLRFLSEDDWKNDETVDRCGREILSRIENRSGLFLTAYRYADASGTDAQGEQRILLWLNILIILLSSFIVGSAYKSHLRRFASDIGVLRSCGAENLQIYAIFIAEFAAVFALSSLSALILSAGVMRLLFAGFLEVREAGFAWLIFRMDPANTALHIAIFFVVLLAVITFTLVRYGNESASSALRGGAGGRGTVRRVGRLRICASPRRSLLALWLGRTNRAHRSCLYVAVPVMTVFLFLFVYLSLDARWISGLPEYELTLSKNGSAGGFTGEEIDAVKGMAEVSGVSLRRVDGELPGAPAGEVYGIDIKLRSSELHREAGELLKRLFPGAGYEIADNLARAERGREMSAGLYLMLLFIFAAMAAFMLIIVYMKLCDYIEDSRGTIRALSTIGAPDGVIRGSYISQSGVAAVIAALLPAVGSGALLLLTTSQISADPALVLTYLAVSAATACAFILPVRCSVNRILGRKGGGE